MRVGSSMVLVVVGEGDRRAFDQGVGVLVEGGHRSNHGRPVVRGGRVQVHWRRHPRRRRRLIVVRIPPSICEISPVHGWIEGS